MKNITVIFPYHKPDVYLSTRKIKSIDDYLYKEGFKAKYILSINGYKVKNILFLHKNNINIKIISTVSTGIGSAIKNSVRHITTNYFYISSPDLPFKLSDLKHMLKYCDEYDIIFGSKLLRSSVYSCTYRRIIASNIQSFLVRSLFPSINIKDCNGSIFGKTKVLRVINSKIKSNGFFFGVELAYNIQKYGYRQLEVPVIYINKSLDSSVRIFRDGMINIISLIKMKLYRL